MQSSAIQSFYQNFIDKNYYQSYRLSWGWAAMWAAVALLWYPSLLLNTDNAWLLYAAERMIGGEIPYVDFYEVNPPLVLVFYTIPAYASRLLSLPVTFCFVFFITAVTLGSLYITWLEIKRHTWLSEPRYGNVVFASLAQVMLCCSPLLFGQREYLFLVLFLPYLVQSSWMPYTPPWSLRSFCVAAMAGLGLCIKPYFAIIWLAGELFSACAAKRVGLLFRPANWVIGVVGVAYISAVVTFTPVYVDKWLPYIMLTYGAFSAFGADNHYTLLVVLGGTVIPCGIALLMMGLDKQRLLFVAKLACWYVAAIAVVILQHKGWINHYFPAIVLGIFLLAVLLVFMAQQFKARILLLNRRTFATAWMLGVICFGFPLGYLAKTYSMQAAQMSYIRKLATYVHDTNSEGKPVYFMSFNLGAAFPIVNALPVTFPFHFNCLWMLPAVLDAEKQGNPSPEIMQAKGFIVSTVAKDMEVFAPSLVIIDNNASTEGPLKDFDFLAYLGHDPVFAQQWRHYQKIGEIDNETKQAPQYFAKHADKPDKNEGKVIVYIRIAGDRS